MKYYNFILSNYCDYKPLNIKDSSCNASLIDNNIYLSRCTNYTFLEPSYKKKYKLGRHLWFNDSIWTDEKLYNNDFSFIKNLTTSNEHHKQASGAEDFRIIKWNNENYGLYSNVIIPFKKNEMHLCKITNNLEIKDDKKIITNGKTEKNWQPIENIPFKCIYSYKPFCLIDLNTTNITEIKQNIFNTNYRGSTQIIKFEDYNLGIIHERKENNAEHYYIHYFVLFDNNMNFLKISKPFSFLGVDIEFCTYISYENEKIKIIASVNDQISFEFNLTKNIIFDSFNNTLNNTNIIPNLYDKLYHIAKDNKNILTAICISTFSNNKDIITDAIILNHDSSLSQKKKEIIQKILLEKYQK